MKVVVKGIGDVTLTDAHYAASGGQASVYVKDGTAYKIYLDPEKGIPPGKFMALSAIQDPCVIKPEQVIQDTKGKAIGYTMRALGSSYSLVSFFAREFRERTNVSPDHILELASKLREHIHNVHKVDILIVDLNENNILVPHALGDTYLIDVDSYHTKDYPATFLNPGVRDYSIASSKDFSTLSDWFSYGVLAFQLFVGIHPYKGSYDPLKGTPRKSMLEARMRSNISVFRKEVRVPDCCYPLDTIPQGFREWLQAVLEEGKRLPPPDPKNAGAIPLSKDVVLAPIKISSGHLDITEVLDLGGWKLVSYAEHLTNTLILVRKDDEMRVLYNDSVIKKMPALEGQSLVGFTSKFTSPVLLNVQNRNAQMYDLDRRTELSPVVDVTEIAKSDDRFYMRGPNRVTEVQFLEFKTSFVMNPKCVANATELSTRLYEGAAIQSMLGATFVALFPRTDVGYQVRIRELDSYRIIDAKFDKVLMVVGFKDGQYDRMIFRFDENYLTYDLRVVDDVSPMGLNFVGLDSGICVSITEEGKIEAFSAKLGSHGVKIVEDEAIGLTMRLMRVRGKVGFEKGGKIYQMTLK